MLSKYLKRHESYRKFVVISLIDQMYYNIRRNISELLCQLDCEILGHQHKIEGLCIFPNCLKKTRLLCLKCLISPDHIQHSGQFILLQECLSENEQMNKLIHFLGEYQVGNIEDTEGQVEWLYNTIIFGLNEIQPLFEIDEIFSVMQSHISVSFQEIRNKFESIQEKSLIKVSSRGSLSYPNFNRNHQVNQFRQEVNSIISHSNQKIQKIFDDIFGEKKLKHFQGFLNENSNENAIFQFENSTEEQNLSEKNLNLSNALKNLNLCSAEELVVSGDGVKNLHFVKELVMSSNQYVEPIEISKIETIIDEKTNDEKFVHDKLASQSEIIEIDSNNLETIPTLPCFALIEKMKTQRKYLGIVKSTSFEDGGKLIRMVSGSCLNSNVSFGKGNMEMRIKLLSELQDCLHIGLIEGGFNGTDYEGQGIWCCLNNISCKSRSNLTSSDFIKLAKGSILGLNINFNTGTVVVKTWTHQKIIDIYKKPVTLVGKKWILFIKSYKQAEIELIN